ncbi:MAG: carbohydrate porin [Mariniphaga sp.]|nr:carbohydrate porin [Mariniphaga sp.]
MRSSHLIITLIALCPGFNSVQAQENPDSISKPFYIEGSYIGDLVSNLNGGIRQGTTYLGLANLKVGVNTLAAGWWKGGEFRINAANTHGGTPSESFVGDFQGVSNIEAGNLTFMYELWYKQTVGNLSLTVGLQDLNSNFAITNNGALFTNSSFGIHPSIADNIPSPIFPLTALGAILQYNYKNKLIWQAAIFDGTPDDFENNPYNTNWNLSGNDGYLAVTEIQILQSLIHGYDGSYKFGAYFHQHCDSTTTEQKNKGFYFVGDQMVYKTLIGGWSLFSQVGLSPKHENKNNYYLSLGVNIKGISQKRSNDEAGIAIAYAGFGQGTRRNETAIELTYLFSANENIRLKPDLQYIIHPAGTEINLPNSFVGSLRIELDF